MYRSESHQSLNTQESFIATNQKKEIVFPNQKENISHIAVDIGGSLAKVVWFSKQQEGGRLNFIKFETAKIDQLIGFIQGLISERSDHISSPIRIKATGGGSHKFYDLFQEKIGVELQKEDEMECLIHGLNFLVGQIQYEVFTYDERRPNPIEFENNCTDIFPYILVNIGSGVSIVKVTSDETYERISGTSLGGGTLWGLLGLLTDAKDYDEMLQISKFGDNKNVDMLVGDIYGGDYNKIGLKSSTIASSFGKVIKCPPQDRKSSFKQEDIALSLLYLVSNNIGQIAYLNAQAHGIQRIFFSGFYISGHAITMNTLSYAISFWSKGRIKAHFLRHEGYLGAIGAFLKNPPEDAKLKSFTENFSQTELGKGNVFGVGALEEFSSNLKLFPFLQDPSTYSPDTCKLQDVELQNYWIDLLDVNLKHLVDLATKKDAESLPRASMFEAMYRQHLSELKTNPNAYGPLTVRGLLHLREQCLREMGFNDIFRGIKEQENAASLAGIHHLFSNIDRLGKDELVETLLNNILAGNMYDWGSAVIQEMLKRGELDFQSAKAKIGFNPNLNQLQKFKQRLLTGKPYSKVMIFVDNSGADIMFGIIPFARYLLSQNTIVILAANSYPSVNDITAGELTNILHQIADPIISTNFQNGKLQVIASGSGAPCLDLSRISEEVYYACDQVDLVMIEGMGRAIQ